MDSESPVQTAFKRINKQLYAKWDLQTCVTHGGIPTMLTNRKNSNGNMSIYTGDYIWMRNENGPDPGRSRMPTG